MNAYAKIILPTDFTKKDGTKPICLRITINRKVKVYSLNIAVTPDHWNFEKSGVKKNHPHSGKYNLVIQNALNKANRIIFDYSLGNKVLSFSDFQLRFFNPRFHSNDFYGFVEYQIQKTTGIISPETLRTHKAHLSKLRKFKENLSFDEIHFQFIESYKKYMITQLGNNENTWNKSLAFLKLMLNRAIKEGIIKENPFKNYPIKGITSHREFLTKDELITLSNLDQSLLNEPERNVLRYFLFACYTGLRFQDIKDLRFQYIQGEMIRITMHKTKEPVKVPLTQKALQIIGKGFPEQKVFRVFANQVTNRYLKGIIEKAQIKKNISFHCARHTFATVGIELDIPIKIISKLLGHQDLKTTQIYTKIINSKKIEEMGLFLIILSTIFFQ